MKDNQFPSQPDTALSVFLRMYKQILPACSLSAVKRKISDHEAFLTVSWNEQTLVQASTGTVFCCIYSCWKILEYKCDFLSIIYLFICFIDDFVITINKRGLLNKLICGNITTEKLMFQRQLG